MPLDVFASIRRRRLDALHGDFLATLPLGSGAGSPPLTLEIGCGHGHYLVAYAAAHPGEFCVGLDLLADRVERARRKAGRAGLANLAFVQADVFLFLEALRDRLEAARPPGAPPAAPLHRVFVLFSDPWPKRRHWKHRVLRPELLDTLPPLSTPDAALHFRTDHPGYFADASELVARHPAWRIATPGEPGGAWPFEHVSVFEERALAGAPQSFTALRNQLISASGCAFQKF